MGVLGVGGVGVLEAAAFTCSHVDQAKFMLESTVSILFIFWLILLSTVVSSHEVEEE